MRYWESEFAQLRPKKNRAGNRAYRVKDIEVIHYIKYLLYQEQFTIPGAKKKLTEVADYEIPHQLKLNLPVPPHEVSAAPNGHQGNGHVVSTLQDVLRILKS